MNPSFYNDRNNSLRQIHAPMKAGGSTLQEFSEAHLIIKPCEPLPASRHAGASFRFFEALLAAGIDFDFNAVLTRTALVGEGPLDQNFSPTLLYVLAKYHDENPYLGIITPRLTYFNGKWMRGIACYIDFVFRLVEITDGLLDIEIVGGVLDNKTGEAWIDVRHVGSQMTERWEISNHGKFMTGELYERLQRLAAERGRGRKFWNMCDGGEDMVFIFASESLVRQIPMSEKFSLTEAWQGAESN
jgi:hypothetical protein